ncbi:MAG: hypothetical protein DMH00_10565 [Acidobacteria bacterium]|nr:MAG: hypothetical protein DMH00_10565 [Acidobacteriota bacterium]
MSESAKPPSLSALPFGRAVGLALASSLSLGLSLGLLDVTMSILRDRPRAFQSLAGVLPPLSTSFPAFFLLVFAILLPAALAPGRRVGPRKGPLIVALATTLGIFLLLAVYYGLVPPRPSPAQSRILFLVTFLSLALGAQRYQRLRATWASPAVPREVGATLLSLPLVLGTGFLFIWGRAYRTAMVPGSWPLLWDLAIGATLALVVAGSIYLVGRIHVERWLGATALLLFLFGVAVVFAGGRDRAASPVVSEKNHPVHRIFFLSIDTLRADAISALRPAAPATPQLDSLAADSVVFTRAYSPAPWTLPTFSTLMTGVTPLVHGVRKFEDRIPTVLPTLAERMREAGYTTAAFGDQLFLHPQHGISRGFQTYELSPRDDYGGSLGTRILGWAFPARFRRALDTTQITDLTVGWLRRHAHDDFFLWLHYFKPHGPYEPLPPYRPKGEPPPGMGFRFSADNEIRTGALVIPVAQRPWVRKLYEGELRYVDDSVGRVLAELKHLGIYDDTLIVFVSDHGEEFWEHDGRAHGHTFYDELLRVPLFVKLPGQGLRVHRNELVCTGSVYPTFLDLAGIPRQADATSYASLLPLLGGPGGPFEESPVLSATPLYYEDRESVVFGEMKYIRSLVTNREQLYDLKDDPRELHNLTGTPTERLVQARAILAAATKSSEALRERYGIRGPSSFELDPQTLEQLRSLGYVH